MCYLQCCCSNDKQNKLSYALNFTVLYKEKNYFKNAKISRS